MRLICSACGATHSLQSLLADTHARESVATALALPAGLSERVLRYLGLFRPPQRALSWDRAAKLLAELNAAIAAGQIQRDGRVWAAPLDYWMQALDATLDARPPLTLPLKNHGYLYAIIAGISSSAAAHAEEAAEVRRRRPREGQPVIFCTAAGAVVTGKRHGSSPVESKPIRAQPPEQFRALGEKLRGTTAPENVVKGDADGRQGD